MNHDTELRTIIEDIRLLQNSLFVFCLCTQPIKSDLYFLHTDHASRVNNFRGLGEQRTIYVLLRPGPDRKAQHSRNMAQPTL